MLILELLGLLLTIFIGAYTGVLTIGCFWICVFNRIADWWPRLVVFVCGLVAGLITWIAYIDIQTFFQTHW